jgi:hypothetical protein
VQCPAAAGNLGGGGFMTIRLADGRKTFLDFRDNLTFESQRPEGAATTPLELSVRQTLYSLRATLPVQGNPRRIEVTGSLRRPCVEVTTTSHLLRWHVRNALAPQLLEATTRVDTEGAHIRVLRSGHRLGGTVSATLERALEKPH